MGYTFVLGGARSGKSTYAEQLAARMADAHGLPVTYLAAAQPSDQEMEERIVRHRQRRPASWVTVEEPCEIAAWIRTQKDPQIILLDCLSLLLNNWMFLENSSEDHILSRIDELVSTLTACPHTAVVVSNEVGQGIVPTDSFSRHYRDWLGFMNQAVANKAETVILTVAGIPVDLRKIQASL